MFAFPTRAAPSYTDVTGFGWDGKIRGEGEIARRIKGEWVITTKEWLTFATKPVKGKTANDWEVYTTKKTSRVRFGEGNNFVVVPNGSVKEITLEQKVFEVLMIPCFIAYHIKMGERCLLGCIGYNKTYDEAVLLGIKQDDPMLEGLMFATLHIKDAFLEDEEVLNAPGYAPIDGPVQTAVEETARVIQGLKNQLEQAEGEKDFHAAFHLTTKIELMEERLEGLSKGIDKLTQVFEREREPVKARISKFGSFKEKQDPGEARLKMEKEVLREFHAQNEEAMKRIKYDTINGVQVINLSHLAVGPAKVEEIKNPEPMMFTITCTKVDQ